MKKSLIFIGIFSLIVAVILAFFRKPNLDDCEIEQPWGV